MPDCKHTDLHIRLVLAAVTLLAAVAAGLLPARGMPWPVCRCCSPSR